MVLFLKHRTQKTRIKIFPNFAVSNNNINFVNCFKIMEKKNLKHKCILLVRVSTYVQNYDVQAEDLIRYAQQKGYDNDDIIVIKNKESATKLSDEEREGLTDMFRLLEEDTERQIDAVFVWEVSRIGRKGETLDRVKNYLISRRTQLYIYKPTIQLLDADGNVNFIAKIVFELMATMAQQENYLKTERTMRTRRQNVENGKVSSGSVLFGFTTDKDGYIMIDEEGGTANTIRTIFNEYLKGEKSVVNIYNDVQRYGHLPHLDNNVSKRDYINKVLSNPSYCGRQKEGKVIKKGKTKGQISGRSTTKYPAIISEETWDKVAELRHARKSVKNGTKHIFFGKGIVDFWNGKHRERMCPKSSTAVYHAAHNGVAVSANLIDSILWEESRHAKRVQMDVKGEERKKQIEISCKKVEDKIATCKNIIKKYEKQIEKNNEVYELGRKSKQKYDEDWERLNKSKKIEEINLQKYNEQQASLKRQMEAVNRNEDTTVTENDIDLIAINDQKKADIIREMVESVEVRKKDNITTISLKYHDESLGLSSVFFYERFGKKANLWKETSETTVPLDYNTFVVNRIERKAYPKKEK